MKKEMGIPVRLDRMRTLLFDERAFHAISQAAGTNVAATFQQYYQRNLVLTLELTQLLVWGRMPARGLARDPRDGV